MLHNSLYTVNVDTASGSAMGGRELSLAGLKDPKGFKDKVWVMKRGGAAGAEAALAMTKDDAMTKGDAMTQGNEAPAQQAMGGGFAVVPPAQQTMGGSGEGEVGMRCIIEVGFAAHFTSHVASARRAIPGLKRRGPKVALESP